MEHVTQRQKDRAQIMKQARLYKEELRHDKTHDDPKGKGKGKDKKKKKKKKGDAGAEDGDLW